MHRYVTPHLKTYSLSHLKRACAGFPCLGSGGLLGLADGYIPAVCKWFAFSADRHTQDFKADALSQKPQDLPGASTSFKRREPPRVKPPSASFGVDYDPSLRGAPIALEFPLERAGLPSVIRLAPEDSPTAGQSSGQSPSSASSAPDNPKCRVPPT